MKKFYLLLIAIFTLSIANAQWQRCNGPWGGRIYSIAVSGNNIFAGVFGEGVYISTNSGNSWTAVNTGLTNLNITSLVIKDSNIFVGSYGGVFKSSNNGNSWTALNTGFTDFMVNSLSISDSIIYANFNDSDTGTYVSYNNGNSWALSSIEVITLVKKGDTLFAGGHGVHFSIDNGNSWTAINNGIIGLKINSLAIKGSTIFAGAGYNKLYSSTNNGDLWNAVNTDLPNGFILSLLTLKDSMIFAGEYGYGIYMSSNNGINWTPMNIGLTNTKILAITVKDSMIFAGTNGGGVFISTNNGNTWVPKDSGIYSMSIYETIATKDNNIFVGSNGDGMLLSSNNGNNWTFVNNGITSSGIYSLAISGNRIFAGAISDLYLSTNNGNNWTLINTGLITSYFIDALAISGNNVFAGTWNTGIFLSTNNGNSWNAVNTGLTNKAVNTLAISGNNIFAGTQCNGITSNGGVYLSTDNGSSWNTVNTGLIDSSYITTLCISGNNIFAGTYYGGVYISSNNGSSWTAANTGLLNMNIRCFVNCGNYIFVGTNDGGVYFSNDNGTSWTLANTGITTNKSIMSLAICGQYIFAGTAGGGIWKSQITDLTGQYIINTTANPSIGGTTSGDGIFIPNQICTIHATSNTNYKFINWTVNGNVVSTDSIFSFNVTSNLNLISNFNLIDNCSAQFTLVADTTTPHHYFAVNNASGILPLLYSWDWGDGSPVDYTAYPSHVYDTAGYYTICLTIIDSMGCISSYCDSSYLQKSPNSMITVNVISQGTLGINTNVLSNLISIYPNPTKENLTIETNSNKEQRLEITNFIGQTIYTNSINKKAVVNTSAFAKGMYILKLYSDKETVVRKFVKE